MLKKASLAVLISTVFMTSAASAEGALPIDLEFGYAEQEIDVNGLVTDQDIDLANEMGHEPSEGNIRYTFDFAHPLPALPNIRFDKVDLVTEGQATLTRDITVGGQPYTTSEDVLSELDLSYKQTVAYWKPMDGEVLDIKLGASLREFDGRFYAESPSANAIEEFSEDIPLAYLGFTAGLMKDVDLSVDVFYAEKDDDKIQDIEARLTSWYDAAAMKVGIEIGYKEMEVRYFGSETMRSNFTSEGLFLGLKLKF